MLFGKLAWAIVPIFLASSLSLALDGHSKRGDGHGSGEPFFYKGFDLSSLKVMEDRGAEYKDTIDGNITKPVEDMLEGMNVVRLRLWVHPKVPYDGGYYETYNLKYILGLAKRFHSKGYRIYLDYHFSDYWADPHKQWQPKEWPDKLHPLADTLRNYVSGTIQAFSRAGVDLSIVSLGNEIRNGMLWPLGQVSVDLEPALARMANFSNLATLYAAARHGVRDAVAAGVTKPEVMIHIDNGWNLTLQERWFSSLTGTGKVQVSDWDIFGFSCYPFYGTEATLANLKTSLNTIANKYNKLVHVVETDWPNKCSGKNAPELSEPNIPISVEGQIQWTRDIIDVVKQVPRGLGRGINYWEPAWLNNTGLGSSCQDAILFSVDWDEFPKVTAYSRESVNMFKGV